VPKNVIINKIINHALFLAQSSSVIRVIINTMMCSDQNGKLSVDKPKHIMVWMIASVVTSTIPHHDQANNQSLDN